MNRRRFLSAAAATLAGVPSFGSFAEQHSPHQSIRRIPVIDVTDLYHPFQDPGDNVDLVYAYALPEIDLRAVILDATQAFRLPVADNPLMWHDPNGPREPGIISVAQLNYLFGSNVPYGIGPFNPLRTVDDKKLDAPGFQQSGVRLILETLRQSEHPIEILSFGSARTIAVAFNREPDLLRQKVARIHLSAGTAAPDFEPGSSTSHNMMPGGEWNVALDPLAFVRLLRSDLPIAIYPCATRDGAFQYGTHNTYWNLPNMHFVNDIDPRLKNYLIYALGRMERPDFLRCLDGEGSLTPNDSAVDRLDHTHHVWETAIWLNVAKRKLVQRPDGKSVFLPEEDVTPEDSVLNNRLQPCHVHVRDNGRFICEATTDKTNFLIFERGDPIAYEAASRSALPALWRNFRLPDC